jgi:hypothetical protein
MQGDVWRARPIDPGADGQPRRLAWRRIAAGLHHPLGMAVVDGVIHVLGRDQITKLIDTNADGCIDRAELLQYCQLLHLPASAAAAVLEFAASPTLTLPVFREALSNELTLIVTPLTGLQGQITAHGQALTEMTQRLVRIEAAIFAMQAETQRLSRIESALSAVAPSRRPAEEPPSL